MLNLKVIEWSIPIKDQNNYFCQGFEGSNISNVTANKGPVKLIKRVQIAHSFLQSVSNQFHVIILSFAM